MNISPPQFDRLLELYNQGYYLQAYHLAQTIGPLTDWDGTPAMLLAGRLADNLGSHILARQLHAKAFRLDPKNGEAAYYKARTIYDRRGPLASWYFLRNIGETITAVSSLQADWLALHAIALGGLRDFAAAEQWLEKAQRLDPTNPWIAIERSHLLEMEDRYEEALAAARCTLDLHTDFRPGVQAVARSLVLLGRDNEALEWLEAAAGRIESCWVVAQLAQLQTELALHSAARQSIERFAQLAPLLDKPTEQWLNAQRADAAYLCGDDAAALRYLQASESEFHKLVAARMQAAPADAARVLLPMGFVRQHHLTCVPATLTLISRFWEMPVEQLSVVEAICYDGTPARSERDWAETHGWLVREFCVTWDDTVTLIDRGVPFTFTIVDPGNAHMQAVIGYDARRSTILVRDPYDRNLIEYAAQETFERYRASGPRGMAMVPLAQRHLLENLKLNDADVYDGLYKVQQALYRHDRAGADEVIQSMNAAAENHRLTHQAQLSVAEYDCDDGRVLACLEKLLELFPEDANWRVYKLSVLRRLARRQERLERLQSACAGKQVHPLFWQMHAAELSDDGRERKRVLKLLQRALRYRPIDAQNYYLLANHLWSQQRFGEAQELYRFAACLQDTREDYARAYFAASCHFREQPQAFQFLTDRFQRFGKRSSFPTRTLAWAYEQTGQEPKALAIVEQGLALRCDDGDLMLYGADLFARVGQFDRAQQWLQQADGKARRVDCLLASAAVAGFQCDTEKALALWRDVAQAEPLNLQALRSIAQLLAETQGDAAAVAFLRERVDRFPHNLALHRLLVERVRNDPGAIEEAVRSMIAVDPVDGWARRELALALAAKREFAQALSEAQLAVQLEPAQTDGYNVLAKVYDLSGQLDDAKAGYRRAIGLSVDNNFAIASLMVLSHSAVERRAVLQFVKQELIRQVIFGEGLLAYREYARDTLDDKELHETLQEALSARPDLWHAWSASILQLTDMQRYDEALTLAQQATARFPLAPRIWFDASLLHRARLDRQGEIDALTRALEINPSWGRAARQLATIHEDLGEWQKARALLDQSVAQTPLDYESHGYLASLLWRLGEREHAIERIERALVLEPGYSWAWGRLRAWCRELGRNDDATAFLRATVGRRAGETRSWLLIAQGLDQPNDLEERLHALDRANQLDPRLAEAHVLRARILTDAKRFDEARAACHPEIFAAESPLRLRIAAAAVEAASGNMEQAREQMYALVAEEPNSYEAWNQLADWTAPDGARQMEYLKAATELVRIAPNYAISWGYLGAARRSTWDPEGAKEAFRRSLALDPNYEYGGLSLFDVELESREVDAARATLQVLKRQIGGDWVTEREVELAVKEKDAETASRRLRCLCQESKAERAVIECAIKPMDWNGMEPAVEQILEESLDLASANPAVGEVFADRWLQRGKDDYCRRRLGASSGETAVWQRAAATYLEKIPKDVRQTDAHQFIEDNAAALKRDDYTWGLVGYTFYDLGRHQDVVDWMADWRARSAVRPWMLWNYVLALRNLDRDAEAYEAGQASRRLERDHASDDHGVFVALDDALANSAEAATEQLRQIRYEGLSAWSKCVYNTAVLIVRAAASSESKRKQFAKLAALREEHPFFWQDKLLFKLHCRAAIKIAESSESMAVKAWTYVLLIRLKTKRAIVQAQDSRFWQRWRALRGF